MQIRTHDDDDNELGLTPDFICYYTGAAYNASGENMGLFAGSYTRCYSSTFLCWDSIIFLTNIKYYCTSDTEELIGQLNIPNSLLKYFEQR